MGTALQNDLWLAGMPCEARSTSYLRRTTSRCITEQSMPEVKDGTISGSYPFSSWNRKVGAFQIQGHEDFHPSSML